MHWVMAAAAGGAILGDNIGFWVGREFGEPLLEKWGHQMLGRYLFARYGGLIVFFGRFVALLRAFAALLAGANGLAPWRFFAFNAARGIVWATMFGLGGYLLGAGIHRIAGPVGWTLLTTGLVAGVVLWRYIRGTRRTSWPGPARDGATRAPNQGPSARRATMEEKLCSAYPS
jgi:membrane protein DedA with SNARE-associated domain